MGFADDVVAQIDELRSEFSRLTERAENADLSGDGVPKSEVITFRIRLRAALDRLAPPGTAYAAEAAKLAEAPERAWAGNLVVKYMDLLAALRADVEKGYVRRIETTVREAVYDDFLEMAEEIFEIHPAPAAVVAGSVLEEHVRKLCAANDIDVLGADGRPRKFEQLSHELVKAEEVAIREPERKVLAGWYGQRTEGAHGRYENVIAEDVPRMIDGIRDFMVRHPA
jgi:hypothetical protein